MKEAPTELARLLPPKAAGWERSGDDQRFTPSSLYDHIDGGAELYLSYGFREALNRRYSRAEQPDIIVDVFDMGDSRNAFGVFVHSRESIEADFGQGSQYSGGFLSFWKERYLISILASPPTNESEAALLEIATHIDSAISEEGTLPEILELLPPQGLIEESIRYFHQHIWLNAHYFLADENILNLDDETEVVLARYGRPSERYPLLIIQYPTADDAGAGHNSFIERFLPERRERQAVELESGKWTATYLAGRYVALVLEAPDEQSALSMLARVETNIGEI